MNHKSLPVLLQALLLLPLVIATSLAQQLPRDNAEEEQRRFHEELQRGQQGEGEKQSGEDVGGRAFWFDFQRRFPFDVIPAGARVDAIRSMRTVQSRIDEARAKAGRSLLASAQWTPIGPDNIGGRVRAIAIHPTDPLTVYIGGAAGGVWKTTDGGATWRSTFDKQTALTIGAIAVDPVNPNNVYVGTGELVPGSDIAFLGDGVFKSTDAGETWRNIGLNNLVATSKIHVRSDNPNIVYLAAGRIGTSPRYSGGGVGSSAGFYRSTNGGETWTVTHSGTVNDMSVDPQNNDNIIISSSSSVQRSTDGGLTFAPATSGLTSLGSARRMSMAHDPQDPTRVYLLQAVNTSELDIGNVFRSTNAGQSWTLVRRLDSSVFRQQGYYNNCIAVDPNDPNTILVGGIDLWRSTDAGSSWTNTSRTFGSTGDRQKAHPDYHIIVFDANTPGLCYVGNDGGCYLSLSSGADFQLMHDQLPISQFYTVEVDQTRPYRVYGGTQDNQTQGGFGTTEHTKVWTRIIGGDGMWVVVDKVDPDIIYAESQFGNLYRVDTRTFDRTYLVAALAQDGGAWSAPAAMSPIDFNLYAGRHNLYRTTTPRGNVRWEKLEPGFSNTASKSIVLSLSPFDSTGIIIGNEVGDIRYTMDDGVTWTRSTGTPSRYPTDLVHDPIERRRVYATFSGFRTGHVFVSDDDGATFRDVSSNLPDIPVNAIEIDPVDNRRLFVGTDIGVYVSLDGGAAWFPYNDGLPVVPVTDMKIHRTRRMLVAATHGRSMFEISIDNIAVPPLLLSPVGGETFATPGSMTIRWSGFDGPVDVMISYRSGEPFTTLASGVTDDSLTVQLPITRSTTARVRVAASGGGTVLTSDEFALSTSANIESLGRRGLTTQAIALRGNQLWATRREDDTIRRFNTPLLTGSAFVVRSGFTGTIRDLAYDASADIFFALVAEDDFSAPRLFSMDTTGAMIAEITLPPSIVSASGIAVVPAGLAVASPGEEGRITIIDKTTGSQLDVHEYRNVRGDYRRGLVWTGMTFTQGVLRTESGMQFPSELHQLAVDDSVRIYETVPVITSSGNPIVFFDLAGENAVNGDSILYATDTSGVIYRFRRGLFSGVDADADMRSASARIIAVTPNPFRADAALRFALTRPDRITIEILSAHGATVATLFNGRVEAGTHTQRITATTLASGLYYAVLTTASGERVISPVVITR